MGAQAAAGGLSFRGAPHQQAGLTLLRWTELGEADHARWDDLGHCTSVANVFCQPWMVRAGLAHCDSEGRIVLAVVRDRHDAWLGVLPMSSPWRHGRAPMPNWRSWLHANQFVGTPLVRSGCEGLFWQTLLEGLDHLDARHVALCLPSLPRDDAVVRALVATCNDQGRLFRHDHEWSRPCLDARGSETSEQDVRLRRRIAGLERKLEREWGEVRFEVSSDPDAIAGLIDPFLELERRGWKGQAGSALACEAGTDGYFRSVAAAAARRGRFIFATLSAGGQMVAISSVLLGSEWSYGFKMAYDEGAAACAPGVLLLDRLTGHLRATGAVPTDSCASGAGHPVNRLWLERLDFVDLCVAIGGPRRRAVFETMTWAEQVFHAVKPGKMA
ncbi:MAG: GNAT family N-acetyltransferase [Sphingomonadales bacterium]|nr:GNAT family N-acetyltransferase [Sphingomonadales bacterium]